MSSVFRVGEHVAIRGSNHLGTVLGHRVTGKGKSGRRLYSIKILGRKVTVELVASHLCTVPDQEFADAQAKLSFGHRAPEFAK